MREFNSINIPLPAIANTDLSAVQDRSIDLEIGAGQGLHAIQYCQTNPDRTLAAIERTKNRFYQLKSRHEHHPDIHNLIPIRADAMAFVAHYAKDNSIDRVFLYYPNPYPKARQANLRWHRSPFIKFLHKKMKPTGCLFLATNLEWYAAEAEQFLCHSGLFHLQSKSILDSSFKARTHFEMKYLARGETCFNLIFKKELQ